MMAVLVVAVSVYVLVAAITDARLHRIPNWLTVPAALLGLLYHTVAPDGMGILAALAGFGVGFLLLLLPALLGGGGMGDVKLLAALGAWLGWKSLLVAFSLGMVLASLGALAVMAYNSLVPKEQPAEAGPTLREMTTGRPKTQTPQRVLPFAVPLALSTWVVLAWWCLRGG
ncbi:MAG: A24 family peptidase [Thermoguttaceae bacterium]|nr:A24 family peptidase [Thermoguttaceae bacterium]MDW8038627.1 A24 family peptidase [Thermoguttaceae bacterium]